MKILLVEPFFEGSHAQWAKGFQKHSQHEVKLLTLAGRHWKWRMYGGAVTLAQQFLQSNFEPDLILASDMLDLCTFQALAKTQDIPTALYFHENQITYPWSPDDADVKLKRNNQYGFLNYTSALCADKVLFNSDFHKESFLGALPLFLGQFPDNKNLETIEQIQSKSEILPLGLDLKRFDKYQSQRASSVATLLWNHRWEYDKNSEEFFKTLFRLKEEKVAFQVIVLGKSYSKSPPIFKEGREKLKKEIIHFGYAESFKAYANLLYQADILPVTSRQDFFGGSVVEAIYCDCHPILPKRLAYPMHIPKEFHQDYFYNNQEGLYLKLKTAIQNVDKLRSNLTYRQFVTRYDWSELIFQYDNIFKSLTK